jgi:hypothetical protein
MGFVAVAVTAAVVNKSHQLDAYATKNYTHKLDQPATEKLYQMPSGVLLVLEIPVNGLRMATERQTCFVWRDSTYQSASLQCPNDRNSYTLDPP